MDLFISLVTHFRVGFVGVAWNSLACLLLFTDGHRSALMTRKQLANAKLNNVFPSLFRLKIQTVRMRRCNGTDVNGLRPICIRAVAWSRRTIIN
jgi:hypothetical protein